MSKNHFIKHLSLYLSQAAVELGKHGQDNIFIKADGAITKGFSTVVKFLCQKSGKPNILGRTTEDEAVVGQWLEYVTTVVERCPKSENSEVLKDINAYLEDKAFFAGFYLTVVDVVFYVALHRIMESLSFHDKQNNIHVCRWFDHVQHLPDTRQHLKEINFQKNLIYSKWTH